MKMKLNVLKQNRKKSWLLCIYLEIWNSLSTWFTAQLINKVWDSFIFQSLRRHLPWPHTGDGCLGRAQLLRRNSELIQGWFSVKRLLKSYCSPSVSQANGAAGKGTLYTHLRSAASFGKHRQRLPTYCAPKTSYEWIECLTSLLMASNYSRRGLVWI